METRGCQWGGVFLWVIVSGSCLRLESQRFKRSYCTMYWCLPFITKGLSRLCLIPANDPFQTCHPSHEAFRWFHRQCLIKPWTLRLLLNLIFLSSLSHPDSKSSDGRNKAFHPRLLGQTWATIAGGFCATDGWFSKSLFVCLFLGGMSANDWACRQAETLWSGVTGHFWCFVFLLGVDKWPQLQENYLLSDL